MRLRPPLLGSGPGAALVAAACAARGVLLWACASAGSWPGAIQTAAAAPAACAPGTQIGTQAGEPADSVAGGASPALAEPPEAAWPPRAEGAPQDEDSAPRSDFRTDLQLARRVLAEFEASRAALLDPRAFADPLLGPIGAPHPAAEQLLLEARDGADVGAWRPRLRLEFRPDGRLASATAWDAFGTCLGLTRFSYTPEGRLLEERRQAASTAAETLDWRRFEPDGAAVRMQHGGPGEQLLDSERIDAEGRLLERRAQEADGTWVEWRAERAPDGALLRVHERRAGGAERLVLSARPLAPLTELCCHHDGAAIPFLLRLQPRRPGETGFELELEPQGARLLLQRAPGDPQPGLTGNDSAASAPGESSDWERLEVRLWQPPRRQIRPLFPRFEPGWLERARNDARLAPAGAAPPRLELGHAEPEPADGALRFVSLEFRDGHWCLGRLERYARARRAFEPTGQEFRLSWQPAQREAR